MGGRGNEPVRSGLYVNGALADIAAERVMQIKRNYVAEHDDTYSDGELAQAAAALALASIGSVNAGKSLWPSSWRDRNFDGRDRRDELVKAGALIAAEISRLDRLQTKEAAK